MDLTSLVCYNVVYAALKVCQELNLLSTHLSIMGEWKDWSLGHSLRWVSNLQGMRQQHSCCLDRAKEQSEQRWDELWVMGGSSQQVAVQQSRQFGIGRFFCVWRLLPQTEASHHLLMVLTTGLAVSKHFKLLKKKICFIHQMLCDIPRPFLRRLHTNNCVQLLLLQCEAYYLYIPCSGILLHLLLCLTGHLSIKRRLQFWYKTLLLYSMKHQNETKSQVILLSFLIFQLFFDWNEWNWMSEWKLVTISCFCEDRGVCFFK